MTRSKVFKSLEGQLGVFEDDGGVVRAPVYTEQGENQGQYDNQTETYQEKVTGVIFTVISARYVLSHIKRILNDLRPRIRSHVNHY